MQVSSQSKKMVVSSGGIGASAGGRGMPVKLILGTMGRITKGGGEGAGVGDGGTGVGGRCCTMELVSGIASVKGCKKYRGDDVQFFDTRSAKAHRGKRPRNGLNLLRVYHPVRGALLPTSGCHKERGLTYSKVKEPAIVTFAQGPRLRPSTTDRAYDAALLVSNRVLRKLIATDTAVFSVTGVAHLVHRVNGEQTGGVTLLIRISEVKGAVND